MLLVQGPDAKDRGPEAAVPNPVQYMATTWGASHSPILPHTQTHSISVFGAAQRHLCFSKPPGDSNVADKPETFWPAVQSEPRAPLLRWLDLLFIPKSPFTILSLGKR